MAWCEEIEIIESDPSFPGPSQTQKRKRIKNGSDDNVNRRRAKLGRTQLSECVDGRVSLEELPLSQDLKEMVGKYSSFSTWDEASRGVFMDHDHNPNKSLCIYSDLSRKISLPKKVQSGESFSQITDPNQSDTTKHTGSQTTPGSSRSLDPMFSATSTRTNYTCEVIPNSEKVTPAEIRGALRSIFASFSKIEQAVQSMMTLQGKENDFPAPLGEPELDHILRDLRNEVKSPVDTVQNNNQSDHSTKPARTLSQPGHEEERDMDSNEGNEALEEEDPSDTKPPSPPDHKHTRVRCRPTVVSLSPTYDLTSSCDDEGGEREGSEYDEDYEETEDGSSSRPISYSTRSRRRAMVSRERPGKRTEEVKRVGTHVYAKATGRQGREEKAKAAVQKYVDEMDRIANEANMSTLKLLKLAMENVRSSNNRLKPTVNQELFLTQRDHRSLVRMHLLSLFYPEERVKPSQRLHWKRFGRMLVKREKRLTNWPHNVPYRANFFVQSLSARECRMLCQVQIEDWTKSETIRFRMKQAEVNLIVSDHSGEPVLTTSDDLEPGL